MISKKKLTAIVVAGLFVTPVMAVAQTVAHTGSINSGDGYAEASNDIFELSIKKAIEEKSPTHIRINAYGKTEDTSKNGTLTLTLTKGNYDIRAVDFLGGTGLETAKTHKSTFTLDNTSLKVSYGVVFNNAARSPKGNEKPDVTADELISTNLLKLTNQSVLIGNVANVYSANNDKYQEFTYVNGKKINTLIHVDGESQWVGDLTERVNLKEEKPNSNTITPEEAVGEYAIKLTGNSSWTGGIDILANSTAEVTLDATSSWTVNKDSKVNSIQFENVATGKAAEMNGVAIADGVTLTVADGLKDTTSTINALHTGAGSTLAVEKANVTLYNFAGKGDIVLNKDGKVTVNAASDKVNATFTSLEGSKFAANEKVNANVTIAGALVDEKGMDAVIKQFNDNKNYEGKGLITFSGGMVADDVFGINDKGQFVQTGTTKNAQLVSIGESTAITMMQWRADADDMYQRMGDLRNNNGSVGVWARTFGGKAEAGHVDNKYYGVQAGVDTQVATTGPKQFVGGAVSYTTGDATFANGTGDNYMGTFTGYSTWLFDNGSYVDVAAKVGKLNNEFDLAVEGKKLAGKYSTQAVALTVESGHRFPVTNLTYVEPQVAFTASHIFGEDYGATNGVTIEQDSINSYVARVGVQAGLNCPDNMGSVFVRASYLYDFDGETSTVAHKANAMDSNRFDQDFGGGWYELGLGMNVNFTKNLYGYADFEYVTGGEIKTPYRWNAGVRYAF